MDRALAILAAFETCTAPVGLSDLARATGFYKSTLLRLLISLDAAGYVSRLRDGRYALGPMAVRLGNAYERINPFRVHVLPAMRDLVEAGYESASFHVLQDATTRLCLLRTNSRHATLDSVAAGQILPLRRGAPGRVLLAFTDLADPALGEVRSAGHAVSFGERDPLCAGVACPVWGPGARLGGALSLSGPRERFTQDAVATMLAALIAAADLVSKTLGGTRPLA